MVDKHSARTLATSPAPDDLKGAAAFLKTTMPRMADAILTPSAGTAPPLDTVLLWLTTTVERDFEERGAFPKMRHASARAADD